PEGAARAGARGLEVVMNRCPKIEMQRLCGELRMGGFATGVVSSRL
ncbi:MAG: CoA-binding protein, partial [Gemmobacter sp.]